MYTLLQDDKESLAELHEYLNSGDMSLPLPLQASTRSPQVSDRRLSNASIKSERRRSLPACTSIISVSTENSIATPRPDVTDFQTRRRRAAKLTQFFGVDYRELIKDVLESIESGLEHERKHGTLDPEEVEVSLSLHQATSLVLILLFATFLLLSGLAGTSEEAPDETYWVLNEFGILHIIHSIHSPLTGRPVSTLYFTRRWAFMHTLTLISWTPLQSIYIQLYISFIFYLDISSIVATL